MPALKLPTAMTPLQMTVPGNTRRRLWAHPEVRSHSLVVLTFDRLYLAPLAGDPKPETVAAVEAGADLDALFGPLATAIDLTAVRNAKLDLLNNSLILEYAAGRLGTSRLTVVFATPDAADAAFTKLWRRLGDGFALSPYRRDNWAVARLPVTLLAGVLLATAVLALSVSIFDDFAAARAAGAANPGYGPFATSVVMPKTLLEVLIGWMNWKWVCGVGGVLAAGLQVWLYRRLTQPPVSLELVRN